MDALDPICTTVLEYGLPADNGVRPHINVTVEAETLRAETLRTASVQTPATSLDMDV